MSVEHEIRQLLSKHAGTNPALFETLVGGSEASIAAEDLLGIILKQDALEHAVLRLAERVDELEWARTHS
jgi:hypothetical protein